MFKIEEYMDELINTLKNVFQERLVYIGLQGSYLRGEQTERSDIDVIEYSCAMKLHFRKSGNQMSGKWKSSYGAVALSN